MKKLLALSIVIALLSSCGGSSGSSGSKSNDLTPDETPTVAVNSHDAVDLGLSVMWATCNIGAATPYQNGDYFVNGGVVPMSGGELSSYDFQDTASANWGEPWRMPTLDEMKELLELKHGLTTINGVKGMQFTGANGNSIFLPCAGTRSWTLEDVGRYGGYWTSNQFREGFITRGNFLCFSDIVENGSITDGVNVLGLPVRPVCPVQQ